MKKFRKKILLVGGEGFVGRNISLKLSEGFECSSLGKSKSIFSKNRKDFFIKKNPYINKIEEDFDIYIYLIDNNVQSDLFYIKENELINNLKIKTNSHLIIFSSAAVYANPESEYAKRKVKLESFYKEYCEKNGIKLTILRLFNTYGKYQLPYKQGSLVANIFYNYLNNLPIEINDKTAKRDFIYAEDIGKIVKYIIENKEYGTIDVGSGKSISIENLLSMIQEKILPTKIDANYKNIKESAIQHSITGDLHKKNKQTLLLEGLKKTFKFYNENKETINEYLNRE